MIETLRTYVFLATWIALLVGALGLVYNVLRNRQRQDWTGARLYWPWVLAFVGATAVAWGPVLSPYFGLLVPQMPENRPPTDAQKLGVLSGPISAGANIERLIQAPNTPYKVKITAPNADSDSSLKKRRGLLFQCSEFKMRDR